MKFVASIVTKIMYKLRIFMIKRGDKISTCIFKMYIYLTYILILFTIDNHNNNI